MATITINKIREAIDYLDNSQYLKNKDYCTNCECFVDIIQQNQDESFVCSSCFNNSHTEAGFSLEFALDFLESNANIQIEESLPRHIESSVLYMFNKIEIDKKKINKIAKL